MWVWFDRLVDLLALIAGMLLCALVVVICLDVGVRYFHLFSMAWSLDASEHGLYLVTFMGAPWVLREQGHIAIDLLAQHLRERPRWVVDRIACGLGAITCATLFYYAFLVWWQSFAANTLVYRTFVFPEWWLLSVAPAIFLIMAVIFMRWLFVGPAPRVAPEAEIDGL